MGGFVEEEREGVEGTGETDPDEGDRVKGEEGVASGAGTRMWGRPRVFFDALVEGTRSSSLTRAEGWEGAAGERGVAGVVVVDRGRMERAGESSKLKYESTSSLKEAGGRGVGNNSALTPVACMPSSYNTGLRYPAASILAGEEGREETRERERERESECELCVVQRRC